MILISHRGNLNGRLESSENQPDYIDLALSNGFDVEIDVWFKNGIIWLGHDKPQYAIEIKWILNRNKNLWIHCKNIEAILYFKELEYDINYFWHQEDDLTLTSMGFLWTYPGKKLTKYSIAVMPEIKQFDDIGISYGICSDYIERYKDL